jgi:hypothetical protein
MEGTAEKFDELRPTGRFGRVRAHLVKPGV